MDIQVIIDEIKKREPNFDLEKLLREYLAKLKHKEELNNYVDWIIENMDY
jgi:hypothetical protein